MVFNATFNNDPVVSWWSIVLMGETEVPGENHIPALVTDKLHHIKIFWVHLVMSGIRTLVITTTGPILFFGFGFTLFVGLFAL